MSTPSRTTRTKPEGTDPATNQPRALAVKIGGRDLWIGNGGAADPETLTAWDLDPTAVVSLTNRGTAATTDHYPLSDGVVNDPDTFADAVEAAHARYREEGPTLVHCAAGISRSSTVIATLLAVEEVLSFGDAVGEVKQYRKRARPHPRLRINALSYLTTRHNRSAAREDLSDLAAEVRLKPSHHGDVLDPLDDQATEVIADE